MPEMNIMDRGTNSTTKHSVGFWLAVIAQWFYAACAGAIALLAVIFIIVPIFKDDDITRLWGLLYFAFFSWTAWLTVKLARNIQSGEKPPSSSFSLNWGSALSLTLGALPFALAYLAVPQAIAVEERARVSEVVSFVGDMDTKQKAFSAKYGRQPASTSEIGPLPPLKYFAPDNMAFKNNSASDWSIKFTRNDLARNRRYGSYAIVYNSSGTPHYDCVDSSHLKVCREELLP